jgi:hypothetical protein
MDLIATQVADVELRYPDARVEQAPEGRVLVVPGVPTADGWTRESVTVRVLVPTGYPHVHPDCFYTEPDLHLGSGTEPANSSIQTIFGAAYRWFSWHVGSWDPNNGSLDKYVRFCEQRLKDSR